jgi:eukaryotic-like serine/threonine-protein kinase
MPSLTVVDGPGRGDQITLGDRATLGRSRDCDLQIKDVESSRVHSEVLRTDDGYVVRDRGSSNGTFLNGEVVTEQPLTDGDRIGVASVTLLFAEADVVDIETVKLEPPKPQPKPEPTTKPADTYRDVPGHKITQSLRGDDLTDRFLATELAMGRTVTVELLSEASCPDTDAAVQCLRAAARLDHPSFVTIYSADVHEGMVWFAREATAGLSMWETAGKMTPDTALEAGIAAAAALTEAHGAKLVHGSFRPDRIVRTNAGHIKILAMGLPAPSTDVLSDTPDLQRRPSRVAYMAPEQLKGHKPSAAADIYSLGASLYHMVTGRMPFMAVSEVGLETRIETDQIVPVRKVNSDVPRDFAELIDSMLARHPAERPESMALVLEDLRALGQKPPAAIVPRLTRAGQEPGGISASTIIIIILTALLLLAGFAIGKMSGTWFLRQGDPAPTTQPAAAEPD